MLALFIRKRTFCKLQVTLYVDCEKQEASITVTYDRRIKAVDPVSFHEVRDPELAKKWLSREVGEHGNFIETLERGYRTGVYVR